MVFGRAEQMVRDLPSARFDRRVSPMDGGAAGNLTIELDCPAHVAAAMIARTSCMLAGLFNKETCHE